MYNYWTIIVHLLKLGIPYDAILSLSEQEINLVLGVNAGLEQRDAEHEAQQQRLNEQRHHL
mgnify:CR=1 FL=1